MQLCKSLDKVLGKDAWISTRDDHVINEFICSRVLITTDVWARGIDVQQVSLVIK